MTSHNKINHKPFVTAILQTIFLFGLIANIPTVQGAEELTPGNKLMCDRLPAPRFDDQSLRRLCLNSKWRFSDKTTEQIWDNYLNLNNEEGFSRNPLMIWVRGYFPENRAYLRPKYLGDGKWTAACVDSDFITRTWQAAIKTPITGVLSKDDILPLIRVMDALNGTKYGEHIQTIKIPVVAAQGDAPSSSQQVAQPAYDASTAIDITGIRFGITRNELRRSLWSWCRPSNLDQKDIVCKEYERPDTSQDGVPKYAILGMPIMGVVFYFDSDRLTSIGFFLNDKDRVVEALSARFGKPSVRVEEIIEDHPTLASEWDMCAMFDGFSKCTPGYSSHLEHHSVSVKHSLRTWNSKTLKVVEQVGEVQFHLFPADGK